MNKPLVATAIVAAVALSSCNSGPKQLTRTWDDWVNQKYTEHSLIHGALLQDILPIYPIVGFFAAVGDILILNPYYFWSKDAWDQKGTGYDHENPTGAERTVNSLMDDVADATSGK